MQNNPEIEQIVDSSVKIAAKKNHEYVTIEHLLLAMIRYASFRRTLEKFGAAVDIMEVELENFIDSQKNITSKKPDTTPKKTHALERVFNRALTQVMFNGRRQITVGDIYLSIMMETNSHAQYFLLKYGITKKEFHGFLQRHYQASEVKMTDEQATEVLGEYCINLTDMAKKR